MGFDSGSSSNVTWPWLMPDLVFRAGKAEGSVRTAGWASITVGLTGSGAAPIGLTGSIPLAGDVTRTAGIAWTITSLDASATSGGTTQVPSAVTIVNDWPFFVTGVTVS